MGKHVVLTTLTNPDPGIQVLSRLIILIWTIEARIYNTI